MYDPKLNGLKYEYFTGKWNVLPDFDLLKPLKKGVVSNLNMDQIKETDNLFGIRFKGWINIPREGSYTFHPKIISKLINMSILEKEQIRS